MRGYTRQYSRQCTRGPLGSKLRSVLGSNLNALGPLLTQRRRTRPIRHLKRSEQLVRRLPHFNWVGIDVSPLGDDVHLAAAAPNRRHSHGWIEKRPDFFLAGRLESFVHFGVQPIPPVADCKALDVAAELSELKQQAKKIPGNSLFVERRSRNAASLKA